MWVFFYVFINKLQQRQRQRQRQRLGQRQRVHIVVIYNVWWMFMCVVSDFVKLICINVNEVKNNSHKLRLLDSLVCSVVFGVPDPYFTSEIVNWKYANWIDLSICVRFSAQSQWTNFWMISIFHFFFHLFEFRGYETILIYAHYKQHRNIAWKCPEAINLYSKKTANDDDGTHRSSNSFFFAFY